MTHFAASCPSSISLSFAFFRNYSDRISAPYFFVRLLILTEICVMQGASFVLSFLGAKKFLGVTDKFWNALRMSTNAVGIFITDGIPAHSDSDTRVSYRVYVFYAYVANGNSSQTLAVKMAFVIYVSNFATSLQ